MTVCRKHIYIDLRIENAIYKTMLFCDFSTPSSFWLSLQWFWMSKSCFRMTLQFLNKAIGFCKCFRLALCKTNQVYFGLIRKFDLICHIRVSLNEWQHLHLA